MTSLREIQYLLNDIICAWRTVVLWDRNKRVIAILLFFILGTAGTWLGFLKPLCAHLEPTPPAAAVCDLYYTIMPLFGTDNRRIEDPSKVGERVLLFVVGPTLATNLLSTGLIAWKAW